MDFLGVEFNEQEEQANTNRGAGARGQESEGSMSKVVVMPPSPSSPPSSALLLSSRCTTLELDLPGTRKFLSSS